MQFEPLINVVKSIILFLIVNDHCSKKPSLTPLIVQTAFFCFQNWIYVVGGYCADFSKMVVTMLIDKWLCLVDHKEQLWMLNNYLSLHGKERLCDFWVSEINKIFYRFLPAIIFIHKRTFINKLIIF